VLYTGKILSSRISREMWYHICLISFFMLLSEGVLHGEDFSELRIARDMVFRLVFIFYFISTDV